MKKALIIIIFVLLGIIILSVLLFISMIELVETVLGFSMVNDNCCCVFYF